ncbi:MAG: transposase [Fimbriimonadaceae bacterium]|nr:transposase [Fimbriimonadaceae bacterium]
MVCRAFLRHLDRARTRHEFDVWAYVLMPDHVHLLVWPRSPSYRMAEIRNAVKQPFAREVLSRMEAEQDPILSRLQIGTRRRFWQAGGGYDRNIVSRNACLSSIEYIHHNPVAAGLAEQASEYPWSSAASHQGLPSEFHLDSIKW